MSDKFYIETYIENKISLEREIVYICPECHRIVKFSLNNFHGLQVTSSHSNIEVERCFIHFTIRCTNCDSYMFQCDKDLANIIADLNHAGIETMHCCQGHIYEIYRPFKTDGKRRFACSYPYVVINPKPEDVERVERILNRYDKQDIEYTWDKNKITSEKGLLIRSNILFEDFEGMSFEDKKKSARKSVDDAFNRLMEVLIKILPEE